MIKLNSKSCIKCELCVKSCPTNAINPLENTVIASRCMGCSHCVAICPTDAVTQNNSIGAPIQKNNFDSVVFENLVYSRKSIRNFKSEELDDSTIDKLLNLMEYSPTGTNSQGTYITVIKGKNKVSAFSKEMIGFFQRLVKLMINPITKPVLLLVLGREKAEKFFSYKKMIISAEDGVDFLSYDCPLILIFHGSNSASTPDMDCNIQSAYSSLHCVTLGLGSCFNGFIAKGLNANKGMKTSLGIPKNNKVYSSLLVGYPELNYKKRVIREKLKVNFVE